MLRKSPSYSLCKEKTKQLWTETTTTKVSPKQRVVNNQKSKIRCVLFVFLRVCVYLFIISHTKKSEESFKWIFSLYNDDIYLTIFHMQKERHLFLSQNKWFRCLTLRIGTSTFHLLIVPSIAFAYTTFAWFLCFFTFHKNLVIFIVLCTNWLFLKCY